MPPILTRLKFFPDTLVPIMIGIGLFCLIFSISVINPRNIGWLDNSDLLQHYLGWANYRDAPWTWPLGANSKYGHLTSSSIVFTDSLPLLAILLKPFSSLLPEKFQYFGIWYLVCFILQAYFAWLISKLLSNQFWLRFCICILLGSAPAFIWRVGLVGALASHFVILAAFYLTFTPDKKARPLYWALLMALTSWIHFYLLTIVSILWICSLLNQAYKAERLSQLINFSIQCLTIILLTLLFMAAAGYFMALGVGSKHFGIWRMNLFAFIDPDSWSYVLPNLSDSSIRLQIYEIEGRRFEGFNYLGLGLLCLSLLAIPSWFKNLSLIWLNIKRYRFTVVACLLLLVFALSNQIGIGTWHYDFAITQPWFDLVSIWRGSARMAWPAYYLLIIFILWGVTHSYRPKLKFWILSLAVLVQLGDSSAGYLKRSHQMATGGGSLTHFESPLRDPFWPIAGAHYARVLKADPTLYYSPLAKFALEHGMETNSASFAREDETKKALESKFINEALRLGPLDPMTLYVISPNSLIALSAVFNPQNDLLALVDNLIVLAPGWKNCQTCVLPKNGDGSNLKEITIVEPTLNTGQLIFFKEKGEGINYLSYGWHSSESWGVWSNGSEAQLVFPKIPLGAKTLHLQFQGLFNDEHHEQRFSLTMNHQHPINIKLRPDSPMNIVLNLASAQPPKEPLIINWYFESPSKPQRIYGPDTDLRAIAIGLIAARFD